MEAVKGGDGPCPGGRVACVGRHRDKGMRMERADSGWGGGGREIKVHTVRHMDVVPWVPSPWHTKPCSGKQAGREHSEPWG